VVLSGWATGVAASVVDAGPDAVAVASATPSEVSAVAAEAEAEAS
jgi:hypothetical protein